jgi:acetylcholinesterase
VFWGNAAGAASIDMLQFGLYAKDPIVKGVIADSAVALLAKNGAQDLEHKSFTYLAEQMGCPTETAEAELECMRMVDPFKVESFLQGHSDTNSTPALWFNPMADNKTVFTVDQYIEMGDAGNFSKLVSSNIPRESNLRGYHTLADLWLLATAAYADRKHLK